MHSNEVSFEFDGMWYAVAYLVHEAGTSEEWIELIHHEEGRNEYQARNLLEEFGVYGCRFTVFKRGGGNLTPLQRKLQKLISEDMA